MAYLPTAASLPSAFLAKQHVLFALRSLKFLPTPYQAEDSNRYVTANPYVFLTLTILYIALLSRISVYLLSPCCRHRQFHP